MRFGLLVALAALVGGGCDSSGGSVAPADAADCPACECKCDCAAQVEADDKGRAGDQGGVAASERSHNDATALAPTDPAAVAELSGSANRKMMHDDGRGCLADLNEIRATDPAMDRRLAVTRGQCEMLVGKCREGKARVADWYVRETAVTRERAEATAESLASMRCRGGNSTDRDELLRALFEISDGAYMNKRDSSWCAARVKTIKRLLPTVTPRDVDDGQISGGGQALFHTAASCHARAGNCKAAFATYRDLFPKAGLSALTDTAARNKVVGDSFDSAIQRCTGKR